METHVKVHGLKRFLFLYFLVLCVLKPTWRLAVMSLITHLQLKKMSVMNESVHVAIDFLLLEMSSITTPNQTIWNVCTRYIFQRVFLLRKISAILPICIMKKSILKFCVNGISVPTQNLNWGFSYPLISIFEGMKCNLRVWLFEMTYYY